MRHKRYFTIIGTLTVSLALNGCVLRQEPPLNSRFFADYTDFQKVDFKDETLVYRHPVTRVTDYDKFIIVPVSVYDNPNKKIKPSHRLFYDDLAQDLHAKLVTLLSKNYKVVDEPGPGVLQLEYAVSDIKPYVWLTKPDGTRYFRTDTVKKGTKFELDCHDSLSDERIFAISTLYSGKDYVAYRDTSLIPKIQDAFENWSRFLDSLLTRAKQDRVEARKADQASIRPSIGAYTTDPADPSIQIYHHPRLKATQYQWFHFAIPHLRGRPTLTSEERKELGIELRREAVKIFDDAKRLVNHPGPEILTVRTLIEEHPETIKFSLECIDPNQGELVMGMKQTLPRADLFDAYRKWNQSLKERWEYAKEDASR